MGLLELSGLDVVSYGHDRQFPLRDMEASVHTTYVAESFPLEGANTPIGGSDELCDT
jgi:hypothetical protein